ncbi:hypothetical protein [Paraburkholderia sp. JHI869]|uniref:hypothetical protein n=1 Tax=Paraburkholderia sp. JHI869 TaxID=3112959 RepID=UPI00317C5EB3
MESITFGQCVKGAWRDGWRYFRHRPALAVLLLLYAWLSSFVANALRPDSTPPFRLLTYVPLGVFELMETALFSLLIMHAIRFVLLETHSTNAQPISGSSYWRFFGCMYGLTMLVVMVVVTLVGLAIALFAGLVIMLAHTSKAAIAQLPVEAPVLMSIVGASFAVIALCVSWFVLTRLSLLHAHVAMGGTLRLQEVWTDTRGHCWSIWLIQLCAGLPTFAASALLTASGLASRHQGHGSFSALNAPAIALGAFGALYIGAPCSAWLYRRYANALKVSLLH